MYLAELSKNWRTLAAAGIGIGVGYQINGYVAGILAPNLISEFGWSKSQYALIGVLPLMSIFSMPFFGRVADIIGVRKTAAIGVVVSPLVYLSLSMMTGSFMLFFMLYLVHLVFVGATSTTSIYTRLVAERFRFARGLALGIVACTPAAIGAILVPFLSNFVDAHGWRNTYVLVAGFVAVGGASALILIPPRIVDEGHVASTKATMADFRMLFRSTPFQIIMVGMLLCNLTILLAGQLKLILLDKGQISSTASLMISFYAFGVIGGRVSCGLALDRFPTHIVAAVGLGLPSIGLLMLGSDVSHPILLGVAVFITGMAFGAEGDIAAFLIMRFFRLQVYSTVYGLVGAATAVSAAMGAVLLSMTLKLTGDFSLFLYISAGATIASSLLFLLLGRIPPIAEPAASTASADLDRQI